MFAVVRHVEPAGRQLQDRADFFRVKPALVFVLADGAGGMCGGAEAAEFVVSGVKAKITQSPSCPEMLMEVLTGLDREMAAAGAYGQAACVLVVVSESQLIGTSVGDAGAWIISQARLDNLTVGQYRKPFVGSGRVCPVGFARGPLRDTLLIASDGLLKYASSEQIGTAALCNDLNEALARLVSLVRYQSGAIPDDLSILLVRPL